MPSVIPGTTPDGARVIRQALQGIYDEMMQRFATNTVVPLLDSAQQLRAGQVVQGVGNGQTLVMPFPAPGTQDPIKVILTAVTSPVSVVHPDGHVDTLSSPGVYTWDLIADASQWETPSIPSNLALVGIAAGTNTATSGTVQFANANNVTFGMNTAGVVTATATVASTQGSVVFTAGTGTFSGSNWSFANANNISWTVNGSTISAQPFFLVRAFSDSTGGGVTSVNAQAMQWLPFVTAQQHVTLAMQTAAGVAQWTPVFWGLKTIRAGTTNTNLINSAAAGAELSFGDASNVSFFLNGSTISADAAARFSAGTTNVKATAFSFSDTNNMSWGLNGSTITGQPFFLASHVGGNSTNVTRFAVQNSNDMTLSLSTGASAATLLGSYQQQFGLVSHVGGNVVSSVRSLVFQNASNVTWSLSTAANGATVLASVAAGGGGGITAVNITAGTTNGNLSNFSFANANNMSFQLNGSTISGQPFFRIDNGLISTNATLFRIANAGQYTLGLTTGASAFSLDVQGPDFGTQAQRIAVAGTTGTQPVTSVFWTNANGVTFNATTAPSAMTLAGSVLTNRALSYYPNTSPLTTQAVGVAGVTNTMWLSPFNGGVPFPANMTADTAEFMVNNTFATNGTGTYAFTMRGGVYTLNNSTQLTLINSFSSTFSATTQATATRNSLIGGGRWISVGAAAWSSSPVFSEGVQYWMGLCMATAGGGAAIPGNWVQWLGNVLAVGQVWQGAFNQSTRLSASVFGPFWGPVNTSSPPVSVGTAQIQNNTASNRHIFWQFRNNIDAF